LSGLGKDVENFENDFAIYIGTTYCIGVASGLNALIPALKACNFEKNGEIIVPSNTYIATILAIIHSGLKPILVEADIRTYNIDPKKIINKKIIKMLLPLRHSFHNRYSYSYNLGKYKNILK